VVNVDNAWFTESLQLTCHAIVQNSLHFSHSKASNDVLPIELL